MNNQRTIPDNEIELIKSYLIQLQNKISIALNQMDPIGRFIDDPWERSLGGGGVTRIFKGGQVFAKAGVNFSHVLGDALPPSASMARPELAGRKFNALGVSLV